MACSCPGWVCVGKWDAAGLPCSAGRADVGVTDAD